MQPWSKSGQLIQTCFDAFIYLRREGEDLIDGMFLICPSRCTGKFVLQSVAWKMVPSREKNNHTRFPLWSFARSRVAVARPQRSGKASQSRTYLARKKVFRPCSWHRGAHPKRWRGDWLEQVTWIRWREREWKWRERADGAWKCDAPPREYQISQEETTSASLARSEAPEFSKRGRQLKASTPTPTERMRRPCQVFCRLFLHPF